MTGSGDSGAAMDEAMYWRCRKEGGAIWLDGRAWLRFTGGDAVRFLNGQCTADVRAWDGSRSLCAAVVTAKGRLCADIYLARDGGGGVVVDGPQELEGGLLERFKRYIVADDVEVEVCGPGYRVLHAWGVPASALRGGRVASPNRRIGPEGADIFCGDAGAPDPGPWACPAEVAEVLRVEAGIPAWGRELDADTLPPEAGAEERWISYSKGCYVGQEVISRIRSVGRVNRRMVGFVVRGEGAPRVGTEVRVGGEVSGRVTSVARSPSLQKFIALGFVRGHDAAVGTEVAMGDSHAVVAALPFVS